MSLTEHIPHSQIPLDVRDMIETALRSVTNETDVDHVSWDAESPVCVIDNLVIGVVEGTRGLSLHIRKATGSAEEWRDLPQTIGEVKAAIQTWMRTNHK
jgi:hypothetical protein